jgi:RNA polymerase sigma factor (sigma-70 family)
MKSVAMYPLSFAGGISPEYPVLDTEIGIDSELGPRNEASPNCACCETPIESEDAALVRGCLESNQQAWEALVDKYKRLIFSVPLRYGASPDDAADVFQSVCIEVFNSLGQLKNPDSLRSWLITVAIRQSYRWRKKQTNHVELDAMDPEMAEGLASVPETVAQLQQEQIVRDVVAKLPPRCAELVRLLFFEQPALPYVEVARRLGLATGSIGFIRGRCLTQLRKLLLQSGFRDFDAFSESQKTSCGRAV